MAISQITPSAPPFLFGEHLAQMTFSEAAQAWLDSRVKIGPRTRADYKQYIAALAKFFGEMQLSDIDIRHVREAAGLRGCEMRALRLADIDLAAGSVSICRTLKTKRSLRKIPLVPSAKWAAENLITIASSKGSVLPHHCLFPKRIHRKLWNPDEPMCATAIGKPWRAMRDAAGLPQLRPHDLRHQVNTKLAESGADDYTITSIMGHKGRQMTEWYSSIREQRKRDAMEKALGGNNG